MDASQGACYPFYAAIIGATALFTVFFNCGPARQPGTGGVGDTKTMQPNAITDRLAGDDRGVSPVIGVILMVAITVILAAVIGTFVLDLGQSAGDTAPSASLSTTADTATNSLILEHKGGDGIDIAQTRIVVTNESNGNSVTFDPGPDSAVASVGGEINVTVADGTDQVDVDGSGDNDAATATNPTNIDSVDTGLQYSVQLIDTESQRVIYETTITA